MTATNGPLGDQLTMKDIGRLVGVEYQTVRIWRRASMAYMRANPGRPVPTSPTVLPAHDRDLDGKPAWDWDTVKVWADQVGRLDASGNAQAVPRPGRVRGSKNRSRLLAVV